ncbi:ABC transporter permease [Pelagirhabdus alkalitolerans]|nr:iron ABC transporter permease [Pelagirhabdus alkalitolerans]
MMSKIKQHIKTFSQTPFSSAVRQKWLLMWHHNPPGKVLFLIGIAIAFIMAIPLFYVIQRSATAGVDRWMRLLDERIPSLLWNTFSLAFMVTLFAVVIGVSLAWFVNRTNLPGAKYWRWLLALPLVIPPYVGAMTYIIVFGPSSWLRGFFEQSTFLGDYPINIYSFWGVFFTLTMFTYPYVYLIASASLRKMNRNFEEVARSQGLTTSQIFWRVNLPFLRPSIGAGAILVSLYVLSDFGAISMLRYVTFTAAIYYQRAGFDTESASVLSLVLIIATVLILWVEARTKSKSNYYQTSNQFREPEQLSLGRWKWFVTGFVWFIFFVSVILPIGVLIYWSYIGIQHGALDHRFFEFAFNSFRLSSFAAIISMALALPLVYLKARHPSIITGVIDRISYVGYALPGVIIALGFVFVFNNHLPILYNTFYVVAIAFVVRFLPQALQSAEASLNLVSPRVDEAARSLGYPPWKIMYKVIFPTIRPGILAGGALVFVSAIKELPATLMLRPPGFDTLAIRVHYEASEALYHQAAPPALIIVLISLIPLRYLLKKY